MQEVVFFLEASGAFGYAVFGLGLLMIGMGIAHLCVLASWSRVAAVALVLLPLLVGASGWLVYRGRVADAIASIDEHSVAMARRYAPRAEPRDAASLRREIAERGYAEARYPLYLGCGAAALGAFLLVVAEIRLGARRRRGDSLSP
ncbi:MAG: hypothetical protein JXR96_29830 [Deltaproteobacteria bacterium]|nr:hypothetical protein [Deltaproteobacteria bacterium]